MGFQVIGSASGIGADVLANTKALVATLKPQDVGALGAFQMGLSSGIMAAGLSSASPIGSFRYGGANLALLRSLYLTMGVLGTGFTAGQITFNLFAARSFSVADTGGTPATLTTNNGKLRTGFAASTAIADFRVSSTASLSAGTRTLDATPFRSITFPVGTGTSAVLLARTRIFGGNDQAWPNVMATSEGFVLQATVPATGTWCFSLEPEWEEVTAF